MIDFSKPYRFRGTHAAYAQYLSTERGKKREGGVNIFSRIMDAYMVSILVGLKYSRTSKLNDDVIYATDIFGNIKEYEGKTIQSSDIPGDVIHGSQNSLNHIYRLVMLNETVRGLSDEEKIANAFKSDYNEEKLAQNLELMNSFARGGLEVLYDRFSNLSSETAILQEQLALFDEMNETLHIQKSTSMLED